MPAGYLYKWTELSVNKWYIGSRTAKGCHINDGYICSSKTVKPLIQDNPEDWIREVLVMGDPVYIRELESKYLTVLQAAQDVMSYNKSNGCLILGEEPWNKGLKGTQVAWNKGLKLGPHSDESNRKRSEALKGRKGIKRSEEIKMKISKTLKGRKQSDEHRANTVAAMLGSKATEAARVNLRLAWVKRKLKIKGEG